VKLDSEWCGNFLAAKQPKTAKGELMTSRSTCLLMLTLSICGCAQPPPSQAIEATAVTRPAPKESVSVELGQLKVDAKSAVLKCRVINHTSAAIWVPIQWGMSKESMQELPFSLLAPPADVMLVFADFTATSRGRHQIIEGMERVSTVTINPGESFEKTVTIPLPFGEGAHYEEALRSPFSAPFFVNEETHQVREIEGLQAVVRYWTRSPNDWPSTMSSQNPEYRLIAAHVLISGDKPDTGNSEPFTRYALSDRIKVHLSVVHGLEIFYTAAP
jgi:hypothetical protein